MIGEHLKVNLRGETPWAEVIEVHDDGFTGKIANKLFREFSEFEKAKFMNTHFDDVKKIPELHKYSYGDVVRFYAITDKNGYKLLVPQEDIDYYK